ncbi:MAG: hypothetical protein WBN90_13325 [Gammaproteobacteria bacterium]
MSEAAAAVSAVEAICTINEDQTSLVLFAPGEEGVKGTTLL